VGRDGFNGSVEHVVIDHLAEPRVPRGPIEDISDEMETIPILCNAPR
jgi:hypothetical protein